jgi:hypothetical protein
VYYPALNPLFKIIIMFAYTIFFIKDKFPSIFIFFIYFFINLKLIYLSQNQC